MEDEWSFSRVIFIHEAWAHRPSWSCWISRSCSKSSRISKSCDRSACLTFCLVFSLCESLSSRLRLIFALFLKPACSAPSKLIPAAPFTATWLSATTTPGFIAPPTPPAAGNDKQEAVTWGRCHMVGVTCLFPGAAEQLRLLIFHSSSYVQPPATPHAFSYYQLRLRSVPRVQPRPCSPQKLKSGPLSGQGSAEGHLPQK